MTEPRNVEDRETLVRELLATCRVILSHGEDWEPEAPSRKPLEDRITWLSEGWPPEEVRAALEEAGRLAAAEYVEGRPR